MPLKLLLDENMRSGALWQAIQSYPGKTDHPLDIVRVGDVATPPLGSSDDAIVHWAAGQERVLISQDVQTLEDAVARRIAAG